MAKRDDRKITGESYIRWDGEVVAVSTLNKEQKAYLGGWIQQTAMNTYDRGRGIRHDAHLPPVRDVFPVRHPAGTDTEVG